MDLQSSILTTILTFIIFFHTASTWLFNCKRIDFGVYTVQKNCILENVFINNETTLFRVFFPPVDLEINYGSIRNFDRAVASRMSNKTKRLTVTHSEVERFFLRDTLEYAEIIHNRIRTVEFDSAAQLKVWMLRLNYNQLLDATFVSEIQTLVILGLNNNLITSVSWNMFSKLKRLKTLDLGNNLIKEIDFRGYLQLPSLRRLVLAGNNIVHFDLGNNVVMRDLKDFNISMNQISTLNTFSLERSFPTIEEVDLNYNPWNCGRQMQVNSLLMFKRVKRHLAPMKVVCHENYLEQMALSAPDGIDKLVNRFNLTQNLRLERLQMQSIDERLISAQIRIGFLNLISKEISAASNELVRKTTQLYELNSLRMSRNINMHS
ncbi:leucine-rich repeats and immunoglobulin-like domains protein sma-10 [Armigeres subalbatus]|uniref:leucine-rich repeats and immunoglobulin-like domains protein sma-10 n=1 Tax=Armigeres subalbatus TaxID=124917 RepID=UPI002ED50366